MEVKVARKKPGDQRAGYHDATDLEQSIGYLKETAEAENCQIMLVYWYAPKDSGRIVDGKPYGWYRAAMLQGDTSGVDYDRLCHQLIPMAVLQGAVGPITILRKVDGVWERSDDQLVQPPLPGMPDGDLTVQ